MANVTPNQYPLHHSRVKVNYSTSGFQGPPHLSYDDGTQLLNFQGPQIRVKDTEIGQLVTVTIRHTIDTESVSYTLLLPAVTLQNSHVQSPIHTNAITTVHRQPLVPPATGQRETYQVEKLEGVARMVLFAANAPGGA